MVGMVRFDQVGKKFRRGELRDTLRDVLAAGLTGLRVGKTRPVSDSVFWALRDVSFEVRPGEALGIIGPNGAGKSTALKLLAGILRCDYGNIEKTGRLSALIEVAAGLHGDLTGIENIHLNGAIMGMTRAEINRKLDAIVSFSGLEKFLSTPVKRYSTGMQARLGFSIAAHVSPDIMLVDEVLSVGDVAFRHRCEERMAKMVADGTTLIFVTHNLEQMRAVCSRTLVLDAGRTTFLGRPAEAVGHYLQAVMHRVGEMSYTDQPSLEEPTATAIDLRYLDEQDRPLLCAYPEEPLKIEISFRLKRPVPRLTVETTMRRSRGDLLISLNSRQQGVTYDAQAGTHQVCIALPRLPVGGGNYFAHVRLWDADRCELLGETPYKFTLQVDDRERATGMVTLAHDWSDLQLLESPHSAEALAGV